MHGRHAYRLELSPDGNILAVLTTDRFGKMQGIPQAFTPPLMSREEPHGAIEVYDLTARQPMPELNIGWPIQKIDLQAALVVGSGGRLLTASPTVDFRRGEVRLWDRSTKNVMQLPYQPRLTFGQFSPDGKMLLTASGRGIYPIEKVQLWDTTTGRPRGEPLLPRGLVRQAAFSPDSKVLAIGCGEGDVQFWKTENGQPVARALRHPGAIHALAFSPDGTKLVTSGQDGMVRGWDLRSSPILLALRQAERVAVVSTDGSRYLQRSEDRKTLLLHDMATGQPCGEPVPYPAEDRAVVLGPDKRTLVVLNKGTTARLWNAVTGQPIGEPLELHEPISGVRFSLDGRTLLLLVNPPTPFGQWAIAYRWEMATGRSLGQEKNPNVSMTAALSPDGRWSLRINGTSAVIVDINSTTVEGKSLTHPGPVTGGLFSPDSRTLLTIAARSGSWEEARLWDRASGEPLGPPMTHQGPIRARVFSPDGKMVLTGCDDGAARLWDAATGKQRGPLMSHGGRIRAVAFHPDGKQLVTAGEDGTVKLWHVATGRPIGPSLPHPSAVSFVTFGPGGESLIARAGEQVRVWKVPQALAGEAKHLLLQAEIETGMELDGSTPRLLEDAERMRHRQQLAEATKQRKN